ncbi:MAG: chemotaxis protein CheW [Eubacteriales bacterium]|nr:chemotaxis protein CheW [Eubacteriales bacterium]
MAEIKYVIFSLGSQKYCMQLSRINGIEQAYTVVPIPLGAECMKGIIHLRNEVIPVYSLKEKLNIFEEDSSEQQLLLAETHDMVIAFEVDTVLGIEVLQTSDVKKVPKVVQSEETGYLESIVHLPGMDNGNADIVLCISVDNILKDVEFENIKQALVDSQKQESEDCESDET